MSKEIVNKIEGTILSDAALAKVDTIEQLAEKNGRLKGELTVALNELGYQEKETKRKLDEAEKKVTITVKEEDSDTRSILCDPFAMALSQLSTARAIKVVTKNIEDLPELADAIIKGEAEQKVKDAEKRAKDAEKDGRKAVLELEKYNKEEKERTEKAIDSAERKNLKEIKGLTILNKVNERQLEANNLEVQLLKEERDLAFEAMQHEIVVLKKKIELASIKSKNLVEGVVNRITSYFYSRKMQTYFA